MKVDYSVSLGDLSSLERGNIICTFVPSKHLVKLRLKVFGIHRCDARLQPHRRLQTSRIDVKLRQDVAETMERRPMSSECKKTKEISHAGIEPAT